MKKGFTLIELIAVLLLVSVLLLAGTVAMLPMVSGFLQVRQQVEAAQKTQLAMARMVRELTTITNVVSSSTQGIVYDFLDPTGLAHRRTLSWSDQDATVRLNSVALSDDVGIFELRYLDHADATPANSWGSGTRLVEFVIGTASTGDVYTNRVRPRNIPTVMP